MTAGGHKIKDGLAIRAANVGDVPAIAALAQELHNFLTGLEEPCASPEQPALTAEVLRREGFGEEPWFSILLAERAGKPVGYLLYHFGYWVDSAARALFIGDIFVRESARGLGIGRALMAEAARIIDRRGGTLVIWSVWNRNPAAIAFYEAVGAKPIGDEIFMAWPSEAWPSRDG